MAELTLLLGGARSGKSELAEGLAAAGGLPVLYLATYRARGDREMAARVAAHRTRRPAGWQTVAAPDDPAAALTGLDAAPRLVLVDSLGMLVFNWLPLGPVAAAARLEALLTALAAAPGRGVLVSDESGLGQVPAAAEARAYRDALGRANRRAAAACDHVFLVVAGLALALKRSGQPVAQPGWGESR